MLDEEQDQMLSARAAAPRTTDDYDYSNYHDIADVQLKSEVYIHLSQIHLNSVFHNS